MPKLYEYLGIVVFFYSSEHEPIHVHGRYQDCESKIDFTIADGRVSNISVKEVSHKKPLPPAKLKDFEHLVKLLADEIVQSWINYFVLNKKIVPKKIEGKL